MTQFGVAAAFEALAHGQSASAVIPPLGVVFSVMTGSVVYSRRFYEEVLRDPPTASPLLFPETVFNAPASHVSACAGSTGPNYTMVGDSGMFLQSLAVAGDWIRQGLARSVLVVGAEESDWTSAGALTRFHGTSVPSEGAGAVLLSMDPTAAKAELVGVTSPHGFSSRAGRLAAAQAVAEELDAWDSRAPVFDSWSGATPGALETIGIPLASVLGDGLGAAGAWACVAACERVSRDAGARAGVRVVGANQQAIGALFSGLTETGKNSAT